MIAHEAGADGIGRRCKVRRVGGRFRVGRQMADHFSGEPLKPARFPIFSPLLMSSHCYEQEPFFDMAQIEFRWALGFWGELGGVVIN